MAVPKVSSGTRIASGRGGDVAFAAPGLIDFLRTASQAEPLFNSMMREAAQQIAQVVVDRAKVNAAAQPPHGKPRPGSSGRSQAMVVVQGLKARRDRIPTITLDANMKFKSKSRNNAKRTRGIEGPSLGKRIPKPGTTVMKDVFFGAEFGGGRRKTTQQFLRHRGRSGYFFWQAVRDSKSYIVQEYSDAIERVLKKLADDAAGGYTNIGPGGMTTGNRR